MIYQKAGIEKYVMAYKHDGKATATYASDQVDIQVQSRLYLIRSASVLFAISSLCFNVPVYRRRAHGLPYSSLLRPYCRFPLSVYCVYV